MKFKVEFYLDGQISSTYESTKKNKIAHAIRFYNKWLGERFRANVTIIKPSKDDLK